LPTTSADFPWIVLRRIASGSASIPDGPFKVDGFDSLSDGSAHYYTIDHDLQPMLLTSPDGKVLVVSRTIPEKRTHVVKH